MQKQYKPKQIQSKYNRTQYKYDAIQTQIGRKYQYEYNMNTNTNTNTIQHKSNTNAIQI